MCKAHTWDTVYLMWEVECFDAQVCGRVPRQMVLLKETSEGDTCGTQQQCEAASCFFWSA